MFRYHESGKQKMFVCLFVYSPCLLEFEKPLVQGDDYQPQPLKKYTNTQSPHQTHQIRLSEDGPLAPVFFQISPGYFNMHSHGQESCFRTQFGKSTFYAGGQQARIHFYFLNCVERARKKKGKLKTPKVSFDDLDFLSSKENK